MRGARTRRLLMATVLAVGMFGPGAVTEGEAAHTAGIYARRGPGGAPARRAPRRSVRHHHRHDHHDDIRRARRGRAITRVVVGTTVRVLPTHCTTVITRNVTYRECGGSYYRTYYRGTEVVYIVVEAP